MPYVLHSEYILFMCSQNKQRLLPYSTLTVWFLYPRWRVFTARYGLSPYITLIRLVFIGLNYSMTINVYFIIPSENVSPNFYSTSRFKGWSFALYLRAFAYCNVPAHITFLSSFKQYVKRRHFNISTLLEIINKFFFSLRSNSFDSVVPLVHVLPFHEKQNFMPTSIKQLKLL